MSDERFRTSLEEVPERRPAALPEYSRAAAAQRMSEKAHPPTRGVHYLAPHRSAHAPGWRTRRHLKRKNLRRSNQHEAAMDRLGTQMTLMPMALIALAIFLVMSSVLVGAVAMVNATQKRFGSDVVTLEDILPKDSLKMYDEHGTLIYQMTKNGLQTTVPLSQISPNLINAEVAIEDQNFWKNAGFDITGIVRAAISNMTLGHVVAGGSTITQQLIKNAIVGNQDTALRKLQEIILAPDITRHYTKEQIMWMYLNTIYYGEQAYGADAAAFTYFGLKDTPTRSAASQLDIAQAATLAGIPSSPIARDPFLHPQASLARTEEVLQQMYLQGYITHDDQLRAIFEAQQPNFFHHSYVTNTAAPHFMQYVIRELSDELHVKPENLSRAGLIVSTTLDLKLQNQILKVAQSHIAALAKAHNMSNAAVVVINYHTGAIMTLVGNIDPNNPQYGAFDVASQGFRQPGSAFKPFIYATAFGEGVSPGTPVLDAPLTVQMCCGLPSYSPHNYDERFHGLISYRQALQNSFNIPAVKLLMQTGVDKSLHTAQIMGIGDNYRGVPNYTMVLGSLSVHLLDMTSAYGVFANGGIRIPPHAVNTVTDVQGHVILQLLQPKGTRVITPQQSFMITDVLSDNVARTYEFGKCSSLYLYTY